MLARAVIVVSAVVVLFLLAGCSTSPSQPMCTGYETREGAIPLSAVKVTPDTDIERPVLNSGEFEDPIPLPGPVNTAGAEDAPVVSRNGRDLFFFFTPDVSVPPEEQLFDCVTGVWWSQRVGSSWSEPVRAWLSNTYSLDGPMCTRGGTLWFASFRQGGYREGDIYTATFDGTAWHWQNAGEQLNADYQIGECYLTAFGDTMVYARASSFTVYGGYDLWESHRDFTGWSEPENLGPAVNGPYDDGWPYLSANGQEIWFTSVSRLGYEGPSVFRSVRTIGGWTEPEEIVSNYAGDAAMDPQGNLYFTHHYVDSLGDIIEADIYVCYRR
jgi:hypothetical protein